MKRAICAALLLACLLGAALPASAGRYTGEGHQIVFHDVIVMRLEKVENWTIVTPENMEEHMDLLTKDGTDEKEVRRRFAEDGILAEAYHSKLPSGRMRMQMFEDAKTRSVWNLADLDKNQRKALKEELEKNLFQGYLRLFNISESSARNGKQRMLRGGVNAYPPSAYESGFFNLMYFNGKAYLMTYTQNTPASNKKLLHGTHTNERVGSMTDMSYVRDFADKLLTPVTDLLPAEELILNAHSGAYTFHGISEQGARVTVETGGNSTAATVDGEGNYTADITLIPGDNEIISTATKNKLSENTLKRVIRADDGTAALELTEYLSGPVDRTKLKVAGRTAPGASVTVKIDEEEAKPAQVQEDGRFSFDVQAEDWVEHTIEITASEPELKDCTARFTFRALYEDTSKGIKAFQKTLSSGVTGKKISARPADYVGSRVKIEVRTTKVQYQDGRLIIHGNISKNKKQPVILVCPDYLDDEIQAKMILTVYGTVIEPSQTETPVPRLDVEYIQYHRTVYKKNTWY